MSIIDPAESVLTGPVPVVGFFLRRDGSIKSQPGFDSLTQAYHACLGSQVRKRRPKALVFRKPVTH